MRFANRLQYQSIYKSNNPCTYMCSLLCQSSNTYVARNRRLMFYRLNINGNNLKLCNEARLTKSFKCNTECTLMGETSAS